MKAIILNSFGILLGSFMVVYINRLDLKIRCSEDFNQKRFRIREVYISVKRGVSIFVYYLEYTKVIFINALLYTNAFLMMWTIERLINLFT